MRARNSAYMHHKASAVLLLLPVRAVMMILHNIPNWCVKIIHKYIITIYDHTYYQTHMARKKHVGENKHQRADLLPQK